MRRIAGTTKPDAYDAKLPLVRGCIVFGYPVAVLKAEAKKGNLVITHQDGQDHVAESAIREMERSYSRRQASLESPRSKARWRLLSSKQASAG